MTYPIHRTRRLRQSEGIRRMVRETKISIDDLILPLFVVEGTNIKTEIKSLPGNYHLSVDKLILEAVEIHKKGIPAVILFGLPEKKDEFGSEAYNDNGIVQKAVKSLKSSIPELIVITDLCLCEYTSHGLCGVLTNDYIDNDKTLQVIEKVSLSYARAGADMIAPSGMMDGVVKTIRRVLDENNLPNTLILSYSAKYASAFYGPFREAVKSSSPKVDKRTHQMDIGNSDEAIREVALDIEEGADIVMIKPALGYLDIINRVKTKFGVPVAAYNVSGEYAMVKSAAEKNLIDEEKVMLEVLTCIKRAGADLIITYFAKQVADLLSK